jgi:hypothetical protein
MVDEVLLLRKISEVEGYLGQVSEYKDIHLDEYQNDWKIQRIVERTLQMMIETCVDIAGHIISDKNYRVPASYVDTLFLIASRASCLLFFVVFSEDKKRELLQKVFWDKDVDLEYILELLDGGPERFPGDKTNLYCRLLTTYGWYTILKLIPFERLKQEALNERVISLLFPRDLREKYQYARRVLSA